MEINITSFFKSADPFEFSASIMERGQNAGKETWANAMDQAKDEPLLVTADQLDALRDHMKGFGAWDAEEIANWSADECNALLIQLISGDIREAGLDTDEPDWDAYEQGAQEGHYAGNIFKGIDGCVYYYLGD